MMKKMYQISLVIIPLSLMVACGPKSEEEWDEEWYEEYDDIAEFEPVSDTVIVAPTQQDLYKEHRVKQMRSDFDDGNYTIEDFDENGRLIREEYFNGEKKKITTYSYELNANGQVVEEIQQEGSKKYVRKFTYDRQGRDSTKVFINDSGESTETTYTYDSEFNTKTEHDQYGSYVSYYNERGLERKMVSKTEDGLTDATIYYEYDEVGNRIKEESSLMGISIIDRMTYNDRGQLLKKERGGTVRVTMIYEYDDKGLCTKFVREGGSLPSTVVYSYQYYE
ncbi:MAG: hypothetical protein KDD41_06315 [Flavobacteriales bacterium]|nr:hypothetical protein [Flavobacteriales bacterium]